MPVDNDTEKKDGTGPGEEAVFAAVAEETAGPALSDGEDCIDISGWTTSAVEGGNAAEAEAEAEAQSFPAEEPPAADNAPALQPEEPPAADNGSALQPEESPVSAAMAEEVVSEVHTEEYHPEKYDLTSNNDSFGALLIECRKRAGFSSQELCELMALSPAYIDQLECGDFSEAKDWFFLHRQVRRICMEMNLEEAQSQQLLQKLEKEYQEYRKNAPEYMPTRATVGGIVDIMHPVPEKGRRFRNFIHRLPGLLLILVLLLILALVGWGVLRPLLQKWGHGGQRDSTVDFAPLVPPAVPAPRMIQNPPR